MATMASEHAQQMQTLTDQINELKVSGCGLQWIII